ncbi:MAG: hypothetical protein AB9873_12170 [Syntrophobacteraceae bacterium]
MAEAMNKAERERDASAKKGAPGAKKAEADARKDAREQYQSDLAEMRLQLEQYRENGEERVRIAKKMADRAAKEYGHESKEYKDMCRLIEQEERRHQAQMAQLRELQAEREREASLGRIELESEEIRTRRELGQISAQQEIQQLIQLENQKYQIEFKALQDRMKLNDRDVLDQAKTYRQMEQLQARHNLRVRQMNNQMRVQSNQTWQQMGRTIIQSFGNAIKGVISGTQSMGDAMRNIMGSVLDMIIDKLMEMVETWIAGLIAGQAQEQAAGATSAVVGAVKAGESVASIPGWGWMAVAGVVAATLGILMGALASAEGGWEVPADTIANVHKGEKILPADKSAALDDVIATYGRSKGGRGGQTVVLNVKANDARSFEAQLKRSNSSLNRQIQRSARNFQLRPIKA